MQKLMGFFKYDLFPYVVSFEIEKFDDKGRAYIHQVGWFRPDQILAVRPLMAGRKLKETLEGLGGEHRKRQDELTHEMQQKVEKILGVPVKA